MTECSCGSGAPDSPSDPAARIEADCSEVLADIYSLLDGECTPETHQKLREHLEACPGCLRHYGIEERIKALIAVKCSGEKAPEGLRQRLRLEISRTVIIRR